MPFKRAPRAASFDYVGCHRYALTICTHRRQRWFTTEAAVAGPRVHLLRTSRDERFDVVADCFMPDHLHVFACGNDPQADLKRFMKTFKQRSSYEWLRGAGSALWQRSYYDRVLRPGEDTWVVARYILGNPVRAGLSTDAAGYPFLGSQTMDVSDLIGSL
jgi:putative transposase